MKFILLEAMSINRAIAQYKTKYKKIFNNDINSLLFFIEGLRKMRGMTIDEREGRNRRGYRDEILRLLKKYEEETDENKKDEILDNIIENFIRFINSYDPTPDAENNKLGPYADWFLKEYSDVVKNKSGFDLEDVNEVCSKFQIHWSNKNRINGNERNIYYFHDIKDFSNYVKENLDISKKQEKKKGESRAEIIYEDSKVLIVWPKTKSAAIYWGGWPNTSKYNTGKNRWCISATGNNNWWYRYAGCTVEKIDDPKKNEEYEQKVIKNYKKYCKIYFIFFINKTNLKKRYAFRVGHDLWNQQDIEVDNVEYLNEDILFDAYPDDEEKRKEIVQAVINFMKRENILCVDEDIPDIKLDINSTVRGRTGNYDFFSLFGYENVDKKNIDKVKNTLEVFLKNYYYVKNKNYNNITIKVIKNSRNIGITPKEEEDILKQAKKIYDNETFKIFTGEDKDIHLNYVLAYALMIASGGKIYEYIKNEFNKVNKYYKLTDNIELVKAKDASSTDLSDLDRFPTFCMASARSNVYDKMISLIKKPKIDKNVLNTIVREERMSNEWKQYIPTILKVFAKDYLQR